MKKCKRCGDDFTPSKGLVNYCSLTCRNSQTHSEETKQKIGKGVQAWFNAGNKVVFTEEDIQRAVENNKLYWKNKLMQERYEDLSPDRIRKRVIYEQDEKCNKCKLDTWQGESLVLELEHKDGNNSNNERSNLEALCPNCHSLTKTWRGRNKRKLQKVTDTELLRLLVKHGLNIRQALLTAKMAAKGGNYKRCHSLIRQLEASEALR